MTSKHHSITPGWLRSSPGKISSPVSVRFGSPILARYLAMSVDGICERMCSQKDSRVGERDFVRKMIRMSVEEIIAMRSPCRRLAMTRSLLAAVFFAEAFAMVVGKGERRYSRGKPSVILPSHRTRTTPSSWFLLAFLPPRNSLFPPSQQDRRFEARTKYADKHAQLRASLKVRRKVIHPLLPHACVVSCSFVLLAQQCFDPSSPIV